MADVDGLVAAARDGDPRALARLISLVEDADSCAAEVAAKAARACGGAQKPYVVGITGAPGVGKSTTTAALIAHWRARGERVAVLAVDPSSPFTGGALLGDRVRMQAHATDGAVFIRSMAARGHLGGLAAATPQVLRVLELGAFGIVLVETVGVGQVEIDIAATADTTVVLLAPGMGDGVQAAKAGLLEVADVLVVNKADRDGADETVRDLKRMLTTAQKVTAAHAADPATAEDSADAVGWRPDVVRAVATSECGVGEVAAAIERHRDWLATSGEGARRRRARVVAEIRAVALGMLVAKANLQVDGAPELTELAGLVESGELDAFSAARQLLAASG